MDQVLLQSGSGTFPRLRLAPILPGRNPRLAPQATVPDNPLPGGPR